MSSQPLQLGGHAVHSGSRVPRWARACRRGEANVATSTQKRHPEALRPVALERRRAPVVEIRLVHAVRPAQRSLHQKGCGRADAARDLNAERDEDVIAVRQVRVML